MTVFKHLFNLPMLIWVGWLIRRQERSVERLKIQLYLAAEDDRCGAKEIDFCTRRLEKAAETLSDLYARMEKLL